MNSAIKNYFRKLLNVGVAGTFLLMLPFAVLPVPEAGGLSGGYVLSFLFVASNYIVVRRIGLDDQKKFLKLFFASLIVRFLLVLACFISVLAFIHISQILFTVSFIISYIFHSIIEIIFINKILENRHDE